MRQFNIQILWRRLLLKLVLLVFLFLFLNLFKGQSSQTWEEGRGLFRVNLDADYRCGA